MKLCTVCHQVYADEATRCLEHGERLKPDPIVGTTLGSFVVSGWLGEGGMGVLYRAEHSTIKRKAAVKVIKREFTADETAAGRFEQEARAVARIGHPNLIDIFDIGTTADGRLYYVMELLEGRALSAKMEQGRVGFSEFAPILVQALGALEAAHKVGIVHRDLKPDNLFLVERPGEPPFVKVLDFGVAKVLGDDAGDGESKLTRTGSIVGTPQYMAPEQIDGTKIDARADVYALGVILYELATGRLPFSAETLGGMLKAHLLDAPPVFAMGQLAPGVPSTLEAVTFKALAKKPDERYASVTALREDLERVMAGQEPSVAGWWKEKLGSSSTLVGDGAGRAALVPAGPTGVMTKVGETLPTRMVEGQPRSKAWMVWLGLGLAMAAAVPAVVLYVRAPAPEQPAIAPRQAAQVEPPQRKAIDLAALRSHALGVLTGSLRDGDPVVRRQAAEVVAGGHDPSQSGLVVPLLQDLVPQVRATAASSLGSLGARNAIAALAAVFGKDPFVDNFVAEALVRLHDDAGAEQIQTRLRAIFRAPHTPEDVRLKAALVLDGMKDRAARRALEQVAASAGAQLSPSTVNVLAHLAKGGSATARDVLVAHLDKGTEAEQLVVAEALTRVGDDHGYARLSKLAADQSSPLRLLAYKVLASLDDSSGYDQFVSALSDTGRPLAERVLAAAGLGLTGDKGALESLAPLLDAPEPSLRTAVAGAILAIVGSDPKAMAAKSLEWATAALGDDSWMMREQAVELLADADASVAVPLLGRALKDDRLEVRRAAARSLGRTHSVAAVAYLGEALRDQHSEVRIAALQSMGMMPDKTMVAPILAKHLETAPPEEKVVAAGELMKLGDDSHAEELKAGLASANPEVRRLAVEESLAAAESSAATGETAKALAKDAASKALLDPSFEVRFAAATRLAGQGSKDGVAVLQEALKRDGAAALKAYGALVALGVPPEVKPRPQTLLDSPDASQRLQAVQGAASLPRADAEAFFKRALRDVDQGVRLAALRAVGEFAERPGNKEAALALVRPVVRDSDAAVRARAEMLSARLAPPPAPAPSPATAAAHASTPAAPPPDLGTTTRPDLLPAPDLALATTTHDAAVPADLAPTTAAAQPGAPIAAPAAPASPAAPAVAVAKPTANRRAAASTLTEDAREEASLAVASGEIALKTGNYPAAIRELQRAHKLNPSLPIYFSLGEAYRKLGDREIAPDQQKAAYLKAIANYRKAREKVAASYADELATRIKGM